MRTGKLGKVWRVKEAKNQKNPADTCRNNNINITSKRRCNVVLTSSFRHVPTGKIYLGHSLSYRRQPTTLTYICTSYETRNIYVFMLYEFTSGLFADGYEYQLRWNHSVFCLLNLETCNIVEEFLSVEGFTIRQQDLAYSCIHEILVQQDPM